MNGVNNSYTPNNCGCNMGNKNQGNDNCIPCGSRERHYDKNDNYKGHNMWDKKRCLQAVYELGFALTEAVLYLDTHPKDCEALNYYMDIRDRYRKVVNYYNDNFGPLDIYHVNNENYWSWVASAMPWEV